MSQGAQINWAWTRKRRRATVLLGSVVITAIAFGSANCCAELASKKSGRHSQPARTTQTVPDTTGAIAKQPPLLSKSVRSGPAQPSTAPDGPIPPLFYLPNVARAKMRACGETWHAKKLDGSSGDDDWRDFAVKCLMAERVTPAH